VKTNTAQVGVTNKRDGGVKEKLREIKEGEKSKLHQIILKTKGLSRAHPKAMTDNHQKLVHDFRTEEWDRVTAIKATDDRPAGLAKGEIRNLEAFNNVRRGKKKSK